MWTLKLLFLDKNIREKESPADPLTMFFLPTNETFPIDLTSLPDTLHAPQAPPRLWQLLPSTIKRQTIYRRSFIVYLAPNGKIRKPSSGHSGFWSGALPGSKPANPKQLLGLSSRLSCPRLIWEMPRPSPAVSSLSARCPTEFPVFLPAPAIKLLWWDMRSAPEKGTWIIPLEHLVRIKAQNHCPSLSFFSSQSLDLLRWTIFPKPALSS